MGERVDAGIVDEDVETPEGARASPRPRARSPARRGCRGSHARARGRRGRESLRAGRVDIGDRHGGAVFGKKLGDRAADAVRCAGDEGDLSREIAAHRACSPLIRYNTIIEAPCGQWSSEGVLRVTAKREATKRATRATVGGTARGGKAPQSDSPSLPSRDAQQGLQPRLLSREDGPLYRQLGAHPAGLDRREAARSGDELPREAELARSFGVSLITVRQALRDLEADGLIRKRLAKPAIVAAGAPAGGGRVPQLRRDRRLDEGPSPRDLELPQGAVRDGRGRVRPAERRALSLPARHPPQRRPAGRRDDDLFSPCDRQSF